MNTFIRWGKFNLVGAMGMVVQLAALAVFSRWAAGHYLCASAAALELTLLHNFVWHLQLHMARPPRQLLAPRTIDPVSSLQWLGFHAREISR